MRPRLNMLWACNWTEPGKADGTVNQAHSGPAHSPSLPVQLPSHVRRPEEEIYWWPSTRIAAQLRFMLPFAVLLK